VPWIVAVYLVLRMAALDDSTGVPAAGAATSLALDGCRNRRAARASLGTAAGELEAEPEASPN
jgi:hypothetical protein